MASELLQFIVRKPRHVVALDGPECDIAIEFTLQGEVFALDVGLIDFSRNGAQLSSQRSVPPGQAVDLKIRKPECQLDVTFHGLIRWQHTTTSGNWAIGCEFDEKVPYETIGELFLTGVLATE